MKICEEYAALLDMYADGFCTEEETAQVRRHLAECPACRAYVEEILLMRAAFPDVEETEVPDGFAEGVMAAIRAEATPRKKRAMVWKRALLPVAACLTLVVALRLVPSMANGGAAQEADAHGRGVHVVEARGHHGGQRGLRDSPCQHGTALIERH